MSDDRYPEHAKQREVLAPRPVNEVLTEFWDWLHEERGYVLASWANVRSGHRPEAVHVSPAPLFAAFLGLNLLQLDREKQAMLEDLRQQQIDARIRRRQQLDDLRELRAAYADVAWLTGEEPS